MAQCKSCSAPLLANTNRCQYCGVRNDVDLQGKHDVSEHTQASGRLCPHCEKSLQTIQIKLDTPLYIERCPECFGMFFDKGELEVLLNHVVQHVESINLAHLNNINADRYRTEQRVKYIKCPVCLNFMHRRNFALKSGVIVDSCRVHGLWLDNGEVTHLMEWKKAGGQLLHQQEQKKNQPKLRNAQASRSDRLWGDTLQRDTISLETDLLELLASIVGKIFL